MALINVKKKIEKASDKLGLGPGEQVVAACATNPSGTVKKMVGFQLGGVVGMAVAAKAGAKTEPETADGSGLAERFPEGRNFLVVTDQRLIVASMSAMSGNPKELVAEWDRGEVTSITVEKGRMASPLSIAFSDGSGVQVEGAKGTNPEALAVALAA